MVLRPSLPIVLCALKFTNAADTVHAQREGELLETFRRQRRALSNAPRPGPITSCVLPLAMIGILQL